MTGHGKASHPACDFTVTFIKRSHGRNTGPDAKGYLPLSYLSQLHGNLIVIAIKIMAESRKPCSPVVVTKEVQSSTIEMLFILDKLLKTIES